MAELEGTWGGRKASFDRPEMKPWLEVMAQKGWTSPTWPEEFGGGGLQAAEAKILSQELSPLPG